MKTDSTPTGWNPKVPTPIESTHRGPRRRPGVTRPERVDGQYFHPGTRRVKVTPSDEPCDDRGPSRPTYLLNLDSGRPSPKDTRRVRPQWRGRTRSRPRERGLRDSRRTPERHAGRGSPFEDLTRPPPSFRTESRGPWPRCRRPEGGTRPDLRRAFFSDSSDFSPRGLGCPSQTGVGRKERTVSPGDWVFGPGRRGNESRAGPVPE